MNRMKSLTFGLIAVAALAVLLIGGVFSSSEVSAGGAKVSVGSTIIDMDVGTTGSVDVTVTGVTGLAAWTAVTINLDGAAVTITGCTAHPDGVCNPNVTGGPVLASGAIPNGQDGPVVLVSIAVECVAAGSADLGLKPVDSLEDVAGAPISATVNGGTITCTTGPAPTDTPVPGEPTATTAPTLGGPETGVGGGTGSSSAPMWLIAALAGAALLAATGYGALRFSARRQ